MFGIITSFFSFLGTFALCTLLVFCGMALGITWQSRQIIGAAITGKTITLPGFGETRVRLDTDQLPVCEREGEQ